MDAYVVTLPCGARMPNGKPRKKVTMRVAAKTPRAAKKLLRRAVAAGMSGDPAWNRATLTEPAIEAREHRAGRRAA